MKKYSNYLYLLSFLAIVIPTPGRFVFGFTICIELILLTVLGTLFNSLTDLLKIKETKTFLLLMFLITITIVFRQIFVIFQTEVALVMSLLFYIPPFSLFLIHLLSKNEDLSLIQRLKTNSIQIFTFSFIALVFFLLRDVFVFGTFTFYGKNHLIYEKLIFSLQPTGFFAFVASIPGVFMIFALILVLLKFIKRKFDSYENLEAQDALS